MTESSAPDPRAPGELVRRRIEADPYVVAADAELEEKIAELVDDPGSQWDLLGYILTEYKPAILDAGLAAWSDAVQGTGVPGDAEEAEHADEPARTKPASRDVTR